MLITDKKLKNTLEEGKCLYCPPLYGPQMRHCHTAAGATQNYLTLSKIILFLSLLVIFYTVSKLEYCIIYYRKHIFRYARKFQTITFYYMNNDSV